MVVSVGPYRFNRLAQQGASRAARSPVTHHTYLREVPLQNGAALFFVAIDREGKTGALSKSTTRRRLFDEGRYIPAIHMRVWPRRALIKWSRHTRNETDVP